MQRTSANKINIDRIHGVTRAASSTNKQTEAVRNSWPKLNVIEDDRKRKVKQIRYGPFSTEQTIPDRHGRPITNCSCQNGDKWVKWMRNSEWLEIHWLVKNMNIFKNNLTNRSNQNGDKWVKLMRNSEWLEIHWLGKNRNILKNNLTIRSLSNKVIKWVKLMRSSEWLGNSLI